MRAAVSCAIALKSNGQGLRRIRSPSMALDKKAKEVNVERSAAALRCMQGLRSIGKTDSTNVFDKMASDQIGPQIQRKVTGWHNLVFVEMMVPRIGRAQRKKR